MGGLSNPWGGGYVFTKILYYQKVLKKFSPAAHYDYFPTYFALDQLRIVIHPSTLSFVNVLVAKHLQDGQEKKSLLVINWKLTDPCKVHKAVLRSGLVESNGNILILLKMQLI